MNTFGFSQGTNGTTQYARVIVPGCGRNERDNAPVILVEIENGKITLSVYADIQSKEATHAISLTGALLKNKVEEVTDASASPTK